MHCSMEVTKMESLNEETEQQYKHYYCWPGFSPTSSFSPAIPRTWCHSHIQDIQDRWIRHGFVIFSDLRAGENRAVSVIFFTFYVHQASHSIMRLSATNTTSLSHPRCRYLAVGAWLFSLFCGHLSRISFTVSLMRRIPL